MSSSAAEVPAWPLLGRCCWSSPGAIVAPMLGFGGDDGAAPVATARRPAIDEEDGVGAAAGGRRAASGERQGARPGDRVAVLRLADLDRVPRSLDHRARPLALRRSAAASAATPASAAEPPSAEELAEAGGGAQAAGGGRRALAAHRGGQAAGRPSSPWSTWAASARPDKKIAVFTNGKAEITATGR